MEFKSFTTMDLSDFPAFVGNRARDRSLKEILRVFCQERERVRLFCSPECESIFSKLSEIASASEFIAEHEFVLQNTPPAIGEVVSPERLIWCTILFVVYEVNPSLSVGFINKVIKLCLGHPTDIVFALLHSEAVAGLIRHHPDTVNPDLLAIVVSSTDDSRALYALRVARWVTDWQRVRTAVYTAILSSTQPKRSEALWVARERGNVPEIIEFASRNGIEVCLSEKQTLQEVTQALANSRHKVGSDQFEYAVKLNGQSVSQVELNDLSALIRKFLNK